jgi:hypothetical protein
MKTNKKLIFAIIIITAISIVIGGTYLINEYKYDQIEKSIYEAELRKTDEAEQEERLYYSDEERKRLQNESEINVELQYELILQNIEENSDYYVGFSKKFLLEFEKYGYDYTYDTYGDFSLGNVIDELKNEFNSNLLGAISGCQIGNVEGIIFVVLSYPDRIRGFDYYVPDPPWQYSYDCSIIYIPDEYMNEESISILSIKIDGFTDENIGNNLFVAKHSI